MGELESLTKHRNYIKHSVLHDVIYYYFENEYEHSILILSNKSLEILNYHYYYECKKSDILPSWFENIINETRRTLHIRKRIEKLFL
jgi:hypothetical protein